jgi:hypothetical protein
LARAWAALLLLLHAPAELAWLLAAQAQPQQLPAYAVKQVSLATSTMSTQGAKVALHGMAMI